MNKMKEFKCKKCNSEDIFISKSGNNTGIYCENCGKWITWLNKDEVRIIERQIANRRKDDINLQKAEIESLKQKNSEAIKAIKEFGGRLKKKISKSHFQNYGLAILEINELLQEMTEVNNE